MTRVVVDASVLGWPGSGIRRYLQRVLERLARDPSFELVLVTNARHRVADVPGAEEVPRRVKGALLWRQTALLHEARRRRADVLWCPWPIMPILPLPCPAVITVHDLSPLMHRGTKPWLSTLAMAVGGRRASARAARVICVSATTADDLSRLWRVESRRIDTIPLAVDEQFCPGNRVSAAEAVYARFGVAQPFLLAVGSVEPRKGYDLLPRLAQLLPDLPLVVAGRAGPKSDELLRELRRSCRVLGAVTDDELLALYRAAELLLVPSLYEGFGLTPLEALACGTPAVVAAGSGALEELLRDVVPVVPRDAGLWAEAVRDALRRRSALAQAGTEHAARRTWEDVARETGAVLRAAAEG